VGRRSNPIGVLGGLLAGAVTSPLVDAFVTPQGIAALTHGERPGDRDHARGGSSVRVKNVKVKRGYEGMDLFVVHFVDKQSGDERMALLMRRDGIVHWRLSGIRLPSAPADDRR